MSPAHTQSPLVSSFRGCNASACCNVSGCVVAALCQQRTSVPRQSFFSMSPEVGQWVGGCNRDQLPSIWEDPDPVCVQGHSYCSWINHLTHHKTIPEGRRLFLKCIYFVIVFWLGICGVFFYPGSATNFGLILEYFLYLRQTIFYFLNSSFSSPTCRKYKHHGLQP